MSLSARRPNRRHNRPLVLASHPNVDGELPIDSLSEQGIGLETAYELITSELLLDGQARLNLATFVTTWMPSVAARLMAETADKNMIDKDEYPQTAEIEARCVNILADLWNSPEHDNATGCSTTGSSEAAMLAGMALKWRWRARREAAGKPADAPEPRHGGQRPGVLGEVLPLLGGRAAPGADGGRHLPSHGRARRRPL